MNCFKYTNNFHLSDRHVIENIKNVFFEFIEVYNHDIHIMGMEEILKTSKLKTQGFDAIEAIKKGGYRSIDTLF